MSSRAATFFTILLVHLYGNGVDSAVSHTPCVSDYQCSPGYFCYEESHYCTQCVDCMSYKRQQSWLACPKVPSNCGACISEFEEEILHERKTRDMCIPSAQNALSQNITKDGYDYGRYVFAAAVISLFLPIMFYAFFLKNRGRERGSIHHGLPNDDPPPYRSIELATPSSTCTNSVERLSEDIHVLRVGRQKDNLVQAIPFRQPDYLFNESELLAFDNNTEDIVPVDIEPSSENGIVSNIDLHDENTMPSDWTPDENADNNSNNDDNQLMTFDSIEPVDVSSDSEETFEPANKRHKKGNSPNHEENCNSHLNINLVINHNVTINKMN